MHPLFIKKQRDEFPTLHLLQGVMLERISAAVRSLTMYWGR